LAFAQPPQPARENKPDTRFLAQNKRDTLPTICRDCEVR
jgi:hypothetical protein